jgi:AP endonuclease-1
MPARTSRKDPAAAPGTSSLNGSKKRAVEETQQHSPSARRSKRTRLSAALDLPDPLASNTTLTPHESFQSTTESNEATIIGPSSFESPITAASEVEVKVEKTEHLDTITGSQRIRRAVNKRISYAEDETADTSVNETKEEEEKPIIHEKPTRKRKTKERKEAVMTPLAARTKGLQMFVGAHVSAAKGLSPLRHFDVHRLSVKSQILGVQNSVLNSVHIG